MGHFVTLIARFRRYTGHRDFFTCATCGEPLVEEKRGRPKDYCSSRCRQRAYRIRLGLDMRDD